MIKQKGTHLALVGLLTLAGLTQEAEALPMFAAQTGMDCSGCHTQHMPRLNRMGRKFAASGMTMSKQVESMVESHTTEQANILDADINPSLLIKSKYARTWDKPDGQGNIKEDDTNDGEYSPIRMATFYVGGRVNENIGSILNLGWRKDEGDSLSGKVVYAEEIEDGYWGVSAYSTQSLGPFSGMEFYNTGLNKMLRTFDNKVYSNSAQATKAFTKASTGVQLYYDKDNLVSGGDHFFITAGIYTPTQDNAFIDMSDNVLPFARIAYEQPIGYYNVMLGAFIISGGDTVSDTETLSMKRETYGFDIQIEGDIADREASLVLTNILKNKIEFTGIGAQSDEGDTQDSYNKALSVEGTISVTPEIIAKLAYMKFDDKFDYRYNGDTSRLLKIDAKDLDSAINVGVDYGFIVTNMLIKLAVEYAWMDPSLDRVKDYESFMATFTLAF